MAAHLEPRTQWTGKQAGWRALEDHQRAMRGRHLRTLFADDLARSERMTAEAAGVFPDYSKNRIDGETPPIADRARRAIRTPRQDRRDVSRREDQRHRKSCGAARGTPHTPGGINPSRRQNVMPRVHAAGAPVSALSWRMRRLIISAIAP